MTGPWEPTSHKPKTPVYVPAYRPQLWGSLSEDDLMAVTLSVKDWKAIAAKLHEDAGDENFGPAESQFRQEVPEGTPGSGPGYAKAYEHDAKVCAAHECAASNERCADTIEQTMIQHGWEL